MCLTKVRFPFITFFNVAVLFWSRVRKIFLSTEAVYLLAHKKRSAKAARAKTRGLHLSLSFSLSLSLPARYENRRYIITKQAVTKVNTRALPHRQVHTRAQLRDAGLLRQHELPGEDVARERVRDQPVARLHRSRGPGRDAARVLPEKAQSSDQADRGLQPRTRYGGPPPNIFLLLPFFLISQICSLDFPEARIHYSQKFRDRKTVNEKRYA